MNPTSLFDNHRINILFIVCVSMLIYLTALSAGVSSLDDSTLFHRLQENSISVSQLFTSSGGSYFRPLTILSYLTDKSIWGLNPAAFHFTAVLIHTANALLVYALALTFTADSGIPRCSALLAALLFAAHPAGSESVVWISGRTDLLCCLFLLLALLVVTRSELAPSTAGILFFAAFACSLAAKESSIVLVAIVPIWLLSISPNRADRRAMAICAAVAAVALLYFSWRSGTTGRLDKGVAAIGTTLGATPMLQLVYDSVAVSGFYIRKVLWPFPLNIAIARIDKMPYFFAGLAALGAGGLACIMRRELRPALAIMFLGLVPPLLAYHADIPWMPIAERYLYIPLVGAALLAARLTGMAGRPVVLAGLVAVMALAVATNLRARLWNTPVEFWADAVAKSPDAAAARVIYAYELQLAGRTAEAARQLDNVRTSGYEDYLYWKCRAKQALLDNDLTRYEADMVKMAGKSSNPAEVYRELAMNLSRPVLRQQR